jgi:hypothetical protein
MAPQSGGNLHVAHLSADGSVIEITINGKLLSSDNDKLLPQLEAAIDVHGTIRLLLRLESCTGFDIGAVLEDIRFELRHFIDLQRVAVVGDRPWEQWLTRIGSLLLAGEVRYFDTAELEEAQRWLLSGGAPNLDPVIDAPLASP